MKPIEWSICYTPKSVDAELLKAHESLVAKQILTLILSSKASTEPPIVDVDLFEI